METEKLNKLESQLIANHAPIKSTMNIMLIFKHNLSIIGLVLKNKQLGSIENS